MSTILLPGFLGSPSDFPTNGIELPLSPEELLSHGKDLTLIGYSMGGRIALLFAALYPERVAQVIAISANPGINDEERAAREKWEEKWLAAMTEPDFLEHWYNQPLFNSLRSSPHFSAMMARRKKTNLERARKLFATYRLSTQPNLWNLLHKMPARFYFGELDTKYLPIHAKLKNMGVKSQLMPGCGHALHIEQPEALKFLIPC